MSCSVWGAAPKQMKAKWQERGAPAVGKEAEVPDAHEAFRKHVQQKSAQGIYRQ